MKITKTVAVFTPITIVLETALEVDELLVHLARAKMYGVALHNYDNFQRAAVTMHAKLLAAIV